jgi:DNA-3-methyladenine glycosylase I
VVEKKRCAWLGDDPLMMKYHDREWGVPLYQDQKLFEFLVLDAFQAGLSWAIVLKKRRHFRQAFDNFNPAKIANYNQKKIAELLKNDGIIKNRLKIEATIANARQFLEVKREFGSFADYIWQFTDHQTIKNRFKKLKDLPAKSKESDAMSRDLKKRGFRFVGSTICYAFMQAAGMVNDHIVSCFRYRECNDLARKDWFQKWQICRRRV